MTPAEKVRALIEELEGEVMLAGFHGYSIDHIKPRLLKLYEEQAGLAALADAEGGEP